MQSEISSSCVLITGSRFGGQLSSSGAGPDRSIDWLDNSVQYLPPADFHIPTSFIV